MADDVACTVRLREWLEEAIRRDASDLHLVPSHPPTCRVHGILEPISSNLVMANDLAEILQQVCTDKVRLAFNKDQDVDFSYSMSIQDELRRFRVNLFVSRQNLAACIRLIPARIPDLDWAGFPYDIAETLTNFRNGLVLITGVTGAGKTTTLAMLVRKLIDIGNIRVITIEEPIEYILPTSAGSVITQREVGTDVRSFAHGLKHGLRQDPDVILLGEIRDRETAQMALTAAETGHLVLSTMHTRDAKGAISRLTDLFPQSVQSEIRSQLAMGLRGIISQHLLANSRPSEKRVLALEILFNTLPVAAAIRTGKLQSIDNCILTGRDRGMTPLAESVRLLLATGQITRATADRYLSD